MKSANASFFIMLLLTLTALSCTTGKKKGSGPAWKYTPTNQTLYEAIVSMDQQFFSAYNNCDLDQQASIYSDSLEFFHDQSGLMTSKQEILASTQQHICGKVSRELVEGSVEVYPIHGYGAVEIGLHRFHNKQEPNAPSRASKFIILWQQQKGEWKIAKVISLH